MAGPEPRPAAPTTTVSALPTAQAELLQVLDASDSAIVITDAHRCITYVNRGFERMFGYRLADVEGRQPGDVLMGPRADKALRQAINEGLQTQGRYSGQALVYDRLQQPRWVSLVINAGKFQSTPDAAGPTVSVLTDITHAKMQEVLQARVLEGMVNELPLPELMNLVCREVERIAPDVVASLLAVDDGGHIHPLAAPGLPRFLHEAIDGLAVGPKAGSCGTAAFRGEPVMVTDIATDPLWEDFRALFLPCGLRACWSSPIKNREGRVVGTFAFYFREPRGPSALHHRLVEVCLHLCAVAIERDAAHARIHQLAYFDALTGLPNRALFRNGAKRTLDQLGQDKTPAALLFIDLDRFKLVNDSQGHGAGDALLCEIAARLRHGIHARDLVARLASDEFAVLLVDCPPARAASIAQRMLQSIAQPVEIQGQATVSHASIGVALFPEDGADVDTLLRHAGQAMTQAKSESGHALRLFSPEMNRRTQERAALERALRQVIDQRGLALHYQPQLHSAAPGGGLYGVEALARWHHPEWGHVPPDRFIPMAEEAGLIQDLTLWLIDEACRQLAEWRVSGLAVPHVALNLSARNFYDPGFADQIHAALQRHKLASRDLMLEVTERVMMDAQPATEANIRSLHARGLRLSLDDFGTGYSSLSYLHRLPITELKLDKSFVQDLATSDTARALTLSVLSIARSLGMTVVAEGVETQEQRAWLSAQGCPVMQGYLFCRPVPSAQLAEWLGAMAAEL